jgi:subtilase family serine protease
VVIDGRSEESGWYRIIFPPNSELHGWVDAEDLDVTGDTTLLRVATPEPAVIVDLPTTDPDLQLTPVETLTPEGTEDPDGTPTPDTGMPDLVIGTTPILSEGQLFITVVNQGTGDATADLVVAIFTVDGSSLLGGATLPGFTLEAGASIDIGTGYMVTEDQALLLIVDPNGDIEESDNTNNQITISIGIEEEPETPTEPPVEEPTAG